MLAKRKRAPKDPCKMPFHYVLAMQLFVVWIVMKINASKE